MKKVWVLLLVTFSACSTAKKPATAQAKLPACIGQMIKKFETEMKQNPPRSIYSYLYLGHTTYYVPAVCCDSLVTCMMATANCWVTRTGALQVKEMANTPILLQQKVKRH